MEDKYSFSMPKVKNDQIDHFTILQTFHERADLTIVKILLSRNFPIRIT